MQTELSPLERTIVRNMMLSTSNKGIAELLERELESITNCVNELTAGTDLVTHQHKLDAKKAAKKLLIIRKPDKKLKKINDELYKTQVNRLAQKYEKTSNRRRESQFKSVEVDYTKMVMVRVDRTTFIYSKPGEEEATKAAFLIKYKKIIDAR